MATAGNTCDICDICDKIMIICDINISAALHVPRPN